MKKIQKLAALSLLFVGALACTKKGGDVDKPEYPIGFSAGATATKALDSESFALEGNKMLVYDLLTTEESGGQTVEYIKNQEIVSPNPAESIIWGTTDGTKYYWVPGVHKFYGFNTVDKSGANLTYQNLFGEAPASSYKTVKNGGEFQYYLQTPEITLSENSNQFDLVYTDIVKRVVDENVSGDAVSLVRFNCKHLFSRFRITAQNISDENGTIVIKSFYIQSLKTKGTTKVAFYDDVLQDDNRTLLPSVSYNLSESLLDNTTHRVFSSVKSGISLTKGADPVEIIGDRIIWPQALLKEGIVAPYFDADGILHYEVDDILMVITYTLGGVDYTKAIRFPHAEDGMEAGKFYDYSIAFSDKLINCAVVVKDWIDVDDAIDYSDNLAAEGTSVLAVDPTTCEWDQATRTARVLDTGEPIKFTFTLSKPDGGKWLAAMAGADFDSFIIEGNNYGPVGQPAEVYVKVKQGVKNASAQLSISVMTATGTVINADDVLQRNKITIVK